MSRLPLALVLCLMSTQMARAMIPQDLLCPDMFGTMGHGRPEDLGGGLVASTESGRIPGLGDGLHEIVTQCASGLSVIVDLGPYDGSHPGEDVRGIAREAATSPEVLTHRDLAARLEAAVRPTAIRESSAPGSQCLCLLHYKDLVEPEAP